MSEHTIRHIGGAVSAIARQDALHRLLKQEEEERARNENEELAVKREHARIEFEESDQGRASAQIKEAERIMRLPTPEALEELERGTVVSDPFGL